MEKLEKYIKICPLVIKRRFTQITKQEEEELKAWLQNNEDNRELYHLTDHIDLTKLHDDYSKTNVEYQLSRFHKKRKRIIIWRWNIAAAGILLMGIISFYMMSKTESITISSSRPSPTGVSLVLSDGHQVNLSTSYHPDTVKMGTAIANIRQDTLIYTPSDTLHEIRFNTLIIPKGTTFHLILSDGTRVWLNANSKITYPVTFRGTTREVHLEGEAFFDVKKNELAPFTVNTERLSINALGTKFNVNTFADNGYVSTALVEGIVEVSGITGTPCRLAPGQIAIIDTIGRIRIDEVDLKPYTAWIDDMFCFRNTPLSEILKQIERYYNVKIIYNTDYQEEYYTGDIYRNKPLQTLLDVLEMTIPVKFELLDRVVHIKSKNYKHY